MIFSLLPDRLAGGVRKLLIASTAMGSMGQAHADTILPPDIETQNRTTVRAAFEKWQQAATSLQSFSRQMSSGQSTVPLPWPALTVASRISSSGPRLPDQPSRNPFGAKGASYLGRWRHGHRPVRRIGNHDFGSALQK